MEIHIRVVCGQFMHLARFTSQMGAKFNKGLRAAFLLASVGFVLVPAASAQTYYFSYADTVSSSTVSGVSQGDPFIIEFAMNNGGGSLVSQQWTTTTDTISVSFGLPDASFLTVFGPKFGDTDNGFATNASGDLTSVPMAYDYDNGLPNVLSTNGSNPEGWFVNGNNGVYTDEGNIFLANVGNNQVPAYWTISTTSAFSAVPEPSTYAFIFGACALGFVGFRRNRLKKAC
jgi:hypothetical protein